jgi:hypothetical protein
MGRWRCERAVSHKNQWFGKIWLASTDENLNWQIRANLPPSRAQRLAPSKELLSRGLSFTEIAAEIGYAHASAFSVAFKAEYGVDPTQWLEAK